MVKKAMQVSLDEKPGAMPVAMLVQVASQFDSAVYLEYGEKRVNAKSIMGMMTLGLDEGDELTVIADGADEEAAVEGVVNFLSGK